jgi:D-alanyl-D-alanine dipeptidase
MESVGFRKNPMEWWHYDVPDAARYPLRDEPFGPTPPAGTSADVVETTARPRPVQAR